MNPFTRLATLMVSLLLALTLACDKGGNNGNNNPVLTSVTFAATNDSEANDTGTRTMEVAKGDTTNTTVYQFTVVGLDQNGDPMDISGLSIVWTITNTSFFDFVAGTSLDGDDETCEVVALMDYFTNGNNPVSTTITVSVNGISASQSYTLEARVNKEGSYDGMVNGFALGLIQIRQNGGTTNYFDWPSAFPATITDTTITWSTNDPIDFTGSITSEGAAMSGTHTGAPDQTWSLTPN